MASWEANASASPEPESSMGNWISPGDFARILLAASGNFPRARARDQQADLAGEALRQRVLSCLVVLDPDEEELEAAMLAIIAEIGEPTGPTRGVCTAIHQEWNMASHHPNFWRFLLESAVLNGQDPPASRRRRKEPQAPS